MPRRLVRHSLSFPNGVCIQSLPYDRPKGRHWAAMQGEVLVGEFKAHQRNSYIRQPAGRENYGRGGGVYTSEMVRTSWVQGQARDKSPEGPENLDPERQFNDWKTLLRALPDPAIRRLRLATR